MRPAFDPGLFPAAGPAAAASGTGWQSSQLSRWELTERGLRVSSTMSLAYRRPCDGQAAHVILLVLANAKTA